MSGEARTRFAIRAVLWATAAWPVICAFGYHMIFWTRTDYFVYTTYGMIATTVALPVMTFLVLDEPSWRRAIPWDVFAKYVMTYVVICGACVLYIARFGV
jgi:hypothetical protein